MTPAQSRRAHDIADYAETLIRKAWEPKQPTKERTDGNVPASEK